MIVLLVAAAAVGLGWLVHITFLQHWLAVHTGTVNEPGGYYGFWSGFGSDLGELTLVTAFVAGLYGAFSKINCHAPGCPRIGKHDVVDTPYRLCRRHHPDVPDDVTLQQIHAHHYRAHDRRARNDPPRVDAAVVASAVEEFAKRSEAAKKGAATRAARKKATAKAAAPRRKK
jgi:hypothetical protein